MAVNIGPKIGIDGEADYRKQINQIVQQQKTLNSEMQKAATVFSKDSDAKKKSAEQTKILTQQIDNQKKRIEMLSKMYEESAKATGETSTATLKWKQALNEAETDLAKMEGQLKEISGSSGLAGVGAAFQEAGKKISEVGKKITEVGTTMTKTVTAPIMGVAAAATAAWKEVDAGMDVIIKKTGASGDALKDMQDRAANLATTIPTSFETAGNAIGEVNTRFGLTGDALEELSKQFIEFADLNGGDVSSSIDSVSKLMESFGLSADQAGLVLDTLNKVGQDTGIGMDTLASSLVTNGSVLRDLGLNLADSAVLMGQLEKAGVDTSTVMTGLSKVQQKAMKNGTTTAQELEKAVSSSGDAMDLFGAKAGPKLYEAFQSGILSLDMFNGGLNTLEQNAGSVSTTFEATLDPIDQTTTMLNELKLIGSDLASVAMDLLGPSIKDLGEDIKGAGEFIRGMDDDQKKMIVTVAGVAAAIGPVITVIGGLVSGIGAVTSAIGVALPVIGTIVGFLGGPLTIAIGAAVAAGALLIANWDTVKETAANLSAAVSEKWQGIKDKTSEIFGNVKDTIDEKIGDAKKIVDDGLKAISNFFKNLKLEFPKIKLPHFSISGEWSWNPPSTPHISVDWYKKAYKNAVMFNSPTVLNTSSGPKGFGDGIGAEIVIGRNTLLDTFTTAVRRANSGGTNNITVNVYPSEGMDEEELAERVSKAVANEISEMREVYA